MCYLWLLGTFVNTSCDIKINVNIVQNCCRNLAVRGLMKILDNIYYNPVCHLACRILKKKIFERTICGMELLEVMLKGGTVTLYPTTVTFQAFRILTIMCVQLANVPLMGHLLESTRTCTISQNSHRQQFQYYASPSLCVIRVT